MPKIIKNDKKRYTTRADLSSLHKKTERNKRTIMSNNMDVLSFDIDSNWYFSCNCKKNN